VEIHEFPRHKPSSVNMGVKSHIQTNSNNNISFYFRLEREGVFFLFTFLSPNLTYIWDIVFFIVQKERSKIYIYIVTTLSIWFVFTRTRSVSLYLFSYSTMHIFLFSTITTYYYFYIIIIKFMIIKPLNND